MFHWASFDEAHCGHLTEIPAKVSSGNELVHEGHEKGNPRGPRLLGLMAILVRELLSTLRTSDIRLRLRAHACVGRSMTTPRSMLVTRPFMTLSLTRISTHRRIPFGVMVLYTMIPYIRTILSSIIHPLRWCLRWVLSVLSLRVSRMRLAITRVLPMRIFFATLSCFMAP